MHKVIYVLHNRMIVPLINKTVPEKLKKYLKFTENMI